MYAQDKWQESEALWKIEEPKPFDKQSLKEVFTRLNITESEFERIIKLPLNHTGIIKLIKRHL